MLDRHGWCTDRYSEKQWCYLKKGALVDFPEFGLIHCEEMEPCPVTRTRTTRLSKITTRLYQRPRSVPSPRSGRSDCRSLPRACALPPGEPDPEYLVDQVICVLYFQFSIVKNEPKARTSFEDAHSRFYDGGPKIFFSSATDTLDQQPQNKGRRRRAGGGNDGSTG